MESLASENASRLSTMLRAEKTINELVEVMNSRFHLLRQNNIDEELFDLIAGFELLKIVTINCFSSHFLHYCCLYSLSNQAGCMRSCRYSLYNQIISGC